MDNNLIIEINFYEDKKTIKLPEEFKLFKMGIDSLFGIKNQFDNLNIFYHNEKNEKNFIKTLVDYNKLISEIKNNKVKTLELEINQNVDLNSNKNSEIENKCSNISSSVISKYNNDSQNNNKKNEIVFQVMCSICKVYNIKNEIYYCSKCNNFVCSNCINNVKNIHEHSYNLISNNKQFEEIKETINKKKEEKINQSNNNCEKKFKPEKNNEKNNEKNIENNENIENNDNKNNRIVPEVQNEINKTNYFEENKHFKIKQMREEYDELEAFDDKTLEKALQSTNWNIDEAINKLFEELN